MPSSGVPGIDDGDPICESWSQLLGTRQVLTLAANFGDLDADELARLEVIAAPLVRRATVEFGEALAGGRRADARRRARGRARRSRRTARPSGRIGRRALVDVGGERRREHPARPGVARRLRAFGPDDVVPTLADLGPELGPLVDDAVDVFTDDAPPWTDDPTLDTSAVEAPATLGYLGDRCPDLSSIGVGDAV